MTIRLNIGSLKTSEFTLKQPRNRQHDVFSPGTTHDLDADRQAFRRRAASYNRAGPAGQVIRHRAAERFQVLGDFAAEETFLVRIAEARALTEEW